MLPSVWVGSSQVHDPGMAVWEMALRMLGDLWLGRGGFAGAASVTSGWGISSDNLGCAWTSASVNRLA